MTFGRKTGTHAFTCGTVFGALNSAAALADELGDARASRYCAAAEELRAGMAAHLWDEHSRRFAAAWSPLTSGYERDMTMDGARTGFSRSARFPPTIQESNPR